MAMGRNGIWPLNLSTTVTKLDVLTQLLQAENGGARQKVKDLAEQIFDDSQHVSPTCPIETGRLISTGRVEKTLGGWSIMYGGEAFDGTEVDYANQVHDDLRLRKYTIPGSGPKFVEIHWLRRTDTADDDLMQAVMDLVNASFPG